MGWFSSHRSTDQCTLNMPRSRRDPVPGTGTQYPVLRYHDPVPGTRCSVSPTTPGKWGTVTTPGIPIIPGSPSSTVTPGESVRPVHTGQKAQLEKADQCLAQSELSVLNSPDRSLQLEHNVHKQPGNMSNLQAEHLSEHSEAFLDFMNSGSPNVKAYESPEQSTATFWTSVFGHRSYRQPFGHRSHW